MSNAPHLHEARKQALATYSAIQFVVCPGLGGERVVCSRKGFRHIAYHPQRTPDETIERLGLVCHIQAILADSHPVISKRIQTERASDGTVDVHYWCFTKQYASYTIKAIVRQVGIKPKQFFSIMRAHENKKTPEEGIAL